MNRLPSKYARLGYAVFPCRPGAKVPLTTNGLKDATRNSVTIYNWWAENPKANVALLTPPEVAVIDADTTEAARRWERRFPELAEAPRHDTPRGGSHYFVYVGDEGPSLKARVRINDEPVDIRGLGKAYVLAPPSETPEGRYSVVRALVQPLDLPKASAALLRLLSGPRRPPARLPRPIGLGSGRYRKYALAALHREAFAVANAKEGARNHTLNASAFKLGGLVALGWLEPHMVEVALASAASHAGLPDWEAHRTIASGLTAGLQHPRDLPPENSPHAA